MATTTWPHEGLLQNTTCNCPPLGFWAPADPFLGLPWARDRDSDTMLNMYAYNRHSFPCGAVENEEDYLLLIRHSSTLWTSLPLISQVDEIIIWTPHREVEFCSGLTLKIISSLLSLFALLLLLLLRTCARIDACRVATVCEKERDGETLTWGTDNVRW